LGEARGRRERFRETRKLKGIQNADRANFFGDGEKQIRVGKDKGRGNQRGTRGIFTTGHGAGHQAGVCVLAVLAIHVGGIFSGGGRDWGLIVPKLVVMFVGGDFANAVNAAIHAIGKQGSGRKRGVEKHYCKEAKQSGRGSNWLVAHHEDTYFTQPRGHFFYTTPMIPELDASEETGLAGQAEGAGGPLF